MASRAAIAHRAWPLIAGLCLFTPARAIASGHGPVFGAATPTLGRGAWSLDQAWTMRLGEDDAGEQMFKSMVTFGITEVVQVSASIPLIMSDTSLAPARMMNSMSNDREIEGLIAYRFHRTPVGIGGRRESTLYVGGTIPTESTRGGSFVINAATGYAGRAHYVWFGGGLQTYFERGGITLGSSRSLTGVYGYRPPVFRAVTGRPDLRLFIEAAFEDRDSISVQGDRVRPGPRTVFVGPTTLLVYKAIALSGGVQWPAYQRDGAGVRESARVAVNFTYFWFR